MSLPAFSAQAELFSTAGLSGSLFAPTDGYRLFAQKVYPALAAIRSKLEACYCTDNGRLAIEPVLLPGVGLLQYLEAMPDRQGVDLLHYHAGWNFALNRQVTLLARVFGEQFEAVTVAEKPQPKTKEQISSERVQNPARS
jgi:hypothetical protein